MVDRLIVLSHPNIIHNLDTNYLLKYFTAELRITQIKV